MDHRVEPPAWLPQGAAPEAADSEADESPAVEDTQAAADSDAAEAAPVAGDNGEHTGRVKSTPLARKVAAEAKVNVASIPGSGGRMA